MYAVVVTFRIKPDQMGAFMSAMIDNARTTLATEPECHRFDVCSDPARPHEVLLYEIYTDRAAFEAHIGTAHYMTFDVHVGGMIEAKNVFTYAKIVS